jgi:hypothetical protein
MIAISFTYIIYRLKKAPAMMYIMSLRPSLTLTPPLRHGRIGDATRDTSNTVFHILVKARENNANKRSVLQRLRFCD